MHMENNIRIIKKFDNSNDVKVWIKNDVVYKKVETDKSSINVSGITFIEPLVMEYARRMGVPTPQVVELFQDQKVFATKYINGINGNDLYKQSPDLQEKLIEVAKTLKEMYSQIGIDREMKLKDLLFSVNGKDIIGCIPVDFERIKYNNNLNWKILLEVADQFGININNAFIPKNVEIKEQRFK